MSSFPHYIKSNFLFLFEKFSHTYPNKSKPTDQATGENFETKPIHT